MGENDMKDTREIFYIGSFGESFFTVALDGRAESMKLLNETPSERCPAVFAMNANNTVLYVGNENSDGCGGVSAFDIADKLNPRLMSFIPAQDSGPCHMSIVYEGESEYLVTGGYFDGYVRSYAVNSDGSIARQLSNVSVEGEGPYHNKNYISRQDHSRMHCVAPIPQTPFFVCADLGGDAIYVYKTENGRIRQINKKKLRAGSGPRHIACAKSGRIMYLVDELDCCVSVLSFSPDTADIEVVQRVSAVPDSWTEDSYCSAIHLSHDERFLYVGNRGHDSIAIFAVEECTKRLSSPSWFTENISQPREFAFDKTGEHLLIGGMETDCVTLNRVDKSNGRLRYLAALRGIKKPACIISAE